MATTKGATDHHFASRRDPFLAMMVRQDEIDDAATAASDPWGADVAAFDASTRRWSIPSTSGLPGGGRPSGSRAGGERPEIDRICRRLDRVARAGALLVEDIDMRSTCCSGGGHGRVLAMARAADPEGDRERVPYG
jgi:hypothetical protein